MNSRERLAAAFAHREPDMLPFDFGGHLISSMHNLAYRSFLDYLGFAEREVEIERYRHRSAVLHDDILTKYRVDTQQIVPPRPNLVWSEDERKRYYRDEWGITWQLDKEEGLYFELARPVFDSMPDLDALSSLSWPDYRNKARTAGMRERFDHIVSQGRVPIADLPLGLELFDLGFNLCGFTNYYMLLALDEEAAGYIMDRQLEAQSDWWNQVFSTLPELEYVRIGDDLGSQSSMLISPEMYRSLVKPRHRQLIEAIKKASGGKANIILHCDGAVEPIISDFIEIGVDCLNPVQYTLPGLEPAELKAKYGSELTFWGGGIDTQSILPQASPQEVRDEVRRQIEVLAPGGGYVFSQVHIIQADVPPENIVAMCEAVNEYR